jgi:hypothetical protein
MNLKKALFACVGILALVAAAVSFLMLMQTGISETIRFLSSNDISGVYNYTGYDFIFGNSDATGFTPDDLSVALVPGLMAAFVLLIASTVGALIGTLASLFSDQRKKGGFFLLAVSGLLSVAAGLMFLFAKNLIGLSDTSVIFGTVTYSYSLGSAFLTAGILEVASGILSVLFGIYGVAAQ